MNFYQGQHAFYCGVDLHARTLSCLVQPAREVDARLLNESLASVRRASSATRFTKNWNHSVPVRGAPP